MWAKVTQSSTVCLFVRLHFERMKSFSLIYTREMYIHQHKKMKLIIIRDLKNSLKSAIIRWTYFFVFWQVYFIVYTKIEQMPLNSRKLMIPCHSFLNTFVCMYGHASARLYVCRMAVSRKCKNSFIYMYTYICIYVCWFVASTTESSSVFRQRFVLS